MVIYGALFIPIISIFVLYRWFKHKTMWWEFAIPFVVSLIFIVMMKWMIEVIQVRSREWWGSFVKKIEYYEDWNEYIHRTCTRTVSCGKNCIRTVTYDCSYVKYHPPSWAITTTTRESIGISEATYNHLAKLFGNQTFVNMHRHYYTNDGDMYFSIWPGDSVRAVPVTTTHSYENRIKAADQSVFHYGKVGKQDVAKYSLKDYPGIYRGYEMDALIGDSTLDALIANRQLNYINGLLGPKKQVRVFVLVFKNQPVEAGIYQEWLWCGGNMNEFILCIGIDNARRVKWCRPISWTHNEELKSEVKQYVQTQDVLNLRTTARYLQDKLNKGFVRRDFKEFDYLTVEPPVWAVILTYLLTLAMNIGMGYWVVKNDFEV